MVRISRKRVQRVCDIFGYELITLQQLGDRKNYWYLYSIIDENGDYVVNRVTLKEAYEVMNKKCREFIGIE